MNVFEREVLAELITHPNLSYGQLQVEFGPVVYHELKELRRLGYVQVRKEDERYEGTEAGERALRGEE